MRLHQIDLKYSENFSKKLEKNGNWLNVLICNGTCQGLKDERKFIQRINFKGFYCLLTKTGIMSSFFYLLKARSISFADFIVNHNTHSTV